LSFYIRIDFYIEKVSFFSHFFSIPLYNNLVPILGLILYILFFEQINQTHPIILIKKSTQVKSSFHVLSFSVAKFMQRNINLITIPLVGYLHYYSAILLMIWWWWSDYCSFSIVLCSGNSHHHRMKFGLILEYSI
jgi:hypothetical protein